LRFVERDPANLSLLSDAAAAAFAEGAPEQAADMIDRYAALSPLPPVLLNLKGLVAIAQQRFQEAAAIFTELRERGPGDPALRFNLAWSKAMMEDYQGALDLLDDDAVAVSPNAPSLKIQMMHHLNLYEEALACGQTLAERYPGNQALMGALATLALDAEKADLALKYAKQAGDNPEGEAALGVLTLGEYDTGRSLELFEHAIEKQPNNARAWVGKGLALLASGESAQGAKALDRGAELFRDHLGSWIAAGWAHFVNGDNAKARASFEKSIRVDPNFSESYGGLAILDVVEGNLNSARRNTEIALRLDRKSFGGAWAKSLLLDQEGNTQTAQRIRDIVLSTPIGPDGKTIAQGFVGFSGGPRKPPLRRS
jgi:tetratricopeptide (TPR) repeat protein